MTRSSRPSQLAFLGFAIAWLLPFAAVAESSLGKTAALAEHGAISSEVAAQTPVDFEVFLPLRNTADLQRLLTAQQTPGSSYQKWLTPAQYAARFGPTPATLIKVQTALRAAGLAVTTVHTRSFHVAGSAAQINHLFQTSLRQVVEADGHTRTVAATRPTLPLAMQQEGARIVSFTGLPKKRTFSTRVATQPAGTDSRYSVVGPYWFDDLKQAYDYPSYQSFLPNGQRLDGTGVKVAVLMGDLLYPGDIAAYFEHEHFSAITGQPDPTVATVLIDGGGAVGGPDATEASLDVQQVLGGAPGATVTLVSIPDLSDEHILDGYTYIVDNPQLFDVVNSSFGSCELYYTAAYNYGNDFTEILRIYDETFQQGNAEGITFVASSSDNGGLDCTTVSYGEEGHAGAFIKGVSTPAASAFVTAVGGGNLITAMTTYGRGAAYVGENGFGDPLIPNDPDGVGADASGGYWGAGGGRSTLVERPSYQASVNTGSSFRTLPDIGMQVGGCPDSIAVLPCGPNRSYVLTAYNIAGNNDFSGLIGTSVAAPEFVGALALYIQKQGRKVGDINPYLYRQGQAQTAADGLKAPEAVQYYHRNIQGFDGAWAQTYPSQNYNYIYGNGSPDVRKLFGLTAFPAAGPPQTASNP